MCEFHDCNCNGLGDIWWTDKCMYFSSIDTSLGFSVKQVYIFPMPMVYPRNDIGQNKSIHKMTGLSFRQRVNPS